MHDHVDACPADQRIERWPVIKRHQFQSGIISPK